MAEYHVDGWDQTGLYKGPPQTTGGGQQPLGDIASLLQQLGGNAGTNLKPVTSVGAAVQPPLPSYGFDPATYGQTGGEATFYGQGVNDRMAPIAALGSLGTAGQKPDGKPVDVASLLAMIQKLLGQKGGGNPDGLYKGPPVTGGDGRDDRPSNGWRLWGGRS